MYGFRFGASDTAAAYYTPKAAAMGLGGLESARLQTLLVHATPPLATAVECFAEQTSRSGEFYVLVTPRLTKDWDKASLASSLTKIEEAMQGSFQTKWEQPAVDTISKQMQCAWKSQKSSLSAFTNMWVDIVGCTADHATGFHAPSPTVEEMNEFCRKHLQLDVSHSVVLMPTDQCVDYTDRWQARASLREAATEYIHANKSRDENAPTEGPHTARHLPRLYSYGPKDVQYLHAEDNTHIDFGQGEVTVVAPRFKQVRRSLKVANANILRHSIEGMKIGLAVDARGRRQAYLDQMQQAEAAGAQVSIGASGAGFSMFADVGKEGVKPVLDLFGALVKPVDYNEGLDRAAFDEVKHAAVIALQSQIHSGMSVASHMLTQRFLVEGSARWTFEDAIKAIEDTSGPEAFKLHSEAWQDVVTVATTPFSVSDPSGIQEPQGVVWGQRPQPMPLLGDSPQHETVVLKTAQAVLGLGRVGKYTTQDPDAMFMLPLLQAISFHSLGSRIYQIREKTGLFYSVSGSFGVGSGPTSTGMDSIVLRVKPHQISKAVARLEEFQTGMATNPSITEFELHSAQAIVADQWVSRVHEHALSSTLVALYDAHPDWKPRMHDLPTEIVKKMQAVTVERINEFAMETFQDPFAHVCTVGPAQPQA